MAKKSYKDLILVLIYKTSGKWTWYQLERALDLRGLGGHINTVKVANILTKEGLVEVMISEQNNPIYCITEQGREKVQEIIEKCGQELFEMRNQNPEDYEL